MDSNIHQHFLPSAQTLPLCPNFLLAKMTRHWVFHWQTLGPWTSNPPSCPACIPALVKGTTTYLVSKATYLEFVFIFHPQLKLPSFIQKQVFSILRLKCVSVSCPSSHFYHHHVCTTPFSPGDLEQPPNLTLCFHSCSAGSHPRQCNKGVS